MIETAGVCYFHPACVRKILNLMTLMSVLYVGGDLELSMELVHSSMGIWYTATNFVLAHGTKSNMKGACELKIYA